MPIGFRPLPLAGTGAADSGAGSSAGVATVAGVGASVAEAAGSSAGAATVTGVGASVAGAAGSSSGSATVTGAGASEAAAAGNSSGVATATGVGASEAAGAGSSAGVATVTGVGDSSSSGSVGTAAGSATVTGVGASVAAAAGSSAGAATVTGVGDYTVGSPASAVAKDALDRALDRAGDDITLQRNTGTVAVPVWSSLTVRAAVRAYRPNELVGGIKQTDSRVIVSSSELAAGSWPAPVKGWRAVIRGKTRAIEHVGPIRVGTEVVRYELRVLG